MRNVLKKAVFVCLVMLSIAAGACDKSKWRAKDFGGPPSWENDMGRPDGYGGEDPWR